MQPGASGDIGRSTRIILFCTLAIGFLHHVDHVLRVDHSGWPFRTDVTPFTFSLIAYPILLFALFGPKTLYWLRWMFLATGAAATLFAHIAIESPQMQFAMWAYNRSIEPALSGVRNICGVRSPALGVTAVVISMTLNVLLVTAAIAMLADRLRRTAKSVAELEV